MPVELDAMTRHPSRTLAIFVLTYFVVAFPVVYAYHRIWGPIPFWLYFLILGTGIVVGNRVKQSRRETD